MRALTEQEKTQFERVWALMDGQYADAEAALVQTELDGQDVAVIAAVTDPDHDGMHHIEPLAILVNETLFARMTPPEENEDGAVDALVIEPVDENAVEAAD